MFIPSVVYAKGQTDIVQLVKTGSYDDVKSAVSRNKNIIYTTSGDTKDTLLITAAKADREYKILGILLKEGLDPSKKNKNDQTALMFACKYSTHEDVIRFLITTGTLFKFQKESRVLQKDKDGKTAFDYAREGNNIKALAVLKEFADDPKQENAEQPEIQEGPKQKQEKSSDQETQNIIDSSEKQETTDTTALPKKEIETESQTSNTGKNSSAEEQKSNSEENSGTLDKEISPSIEESDSEAEQESDATETSSQPQKATGTIKSSVSESQTPSISSSEQTGEKPDRSVIEPYKPVYMFDFKDIDKTEKSMKQSAEVPAISLPEINRQDTDGRTYLMKACIKNDKNTVSFLINNNANISLKDNDGWTALLYAVRFNAAPEIVEQLLNAGADRTTKNKFGITPLDTAAGFCIDPNVFKLLLNNLSPAEQDFKRMFINSIESQRPTNVIKVFINKGADLNKIYGKYTPLMYAAMTNTSTDIIDLLLKNGASTEIRTQKGESAFDFASKNENLPHNDIYWKLNSQSKN